MTPLLLTAGISGGEASTTKSDDIYLLSAMVVIMGFFAIVSLLGDKAGKALLFYATVVVTLLFWKPHLFVYEKTVTEHAPYTVTGALLKIDKNDNEEYEPTVTLDGGEKVKVKENAKDLYQFIGSQVTLRCDYDKMPDKKITGSTSCDFQGAGSDPAPSVSN